MQKLQSCVLLHFYVDSRASYDGRIDGPSVSQNSSAARQNLFAAILPSSGFLWLLRQQTNSFLACYSHMVIFITFYNLLYELYHLMYIQNIFPHYLVLKVSPPRVFFHQKYITKNAP